MRLQLLGQNAEVLGLYTVLMATIRFTFNDHRACTPSIQIFANQF